MTQEQTIDKSNKLAIAKQDANSEFKPVLIPSFGGAKIPAAVVFLQNRTKKVYESYSVDTDEIKMQKKIVNGVEKMMPVFERKPIKMPNGKMGFINNPVLTGNKVEKKIRFVKEESSNPVTKTVAFECSDVSDLRKKIGEAFTVFETAIEASKHNFAKSQILHVNVKIGDQVFSTTCLPEGGVKLSRLFFKGSYQSDRFAKEFCKPLFVQLQSIEKNENGKPLTVSDAVLKELGLIKK